ncbi:MULTISPECIES: 23S rRNA (pseudouridine(1915)-N(3))-methyltransferase RlmH [unclassified Mitsuokella]|uniref:23S rRNA (pseudouridine(1915)-N(3))-methyltransferase RlmH n=1 Tax=unclassified Mitsuokella TaxID=2637239 RepID=UPI000E4CC3FC|nr:MULTISPECIES: 23S rRNA (pseudouridine(1915)-N(3))-methyltransferase RlmH [unclassified Mitsuokella]RGS70144.1 23S rRNA (pseudouridine(1915)-N(3))-methyltransferase RlmH [Mitsuokella sp. AF21-1AC]RHM53041.1 23S rRNA (pseudouridine(1915)-N(3))-methyltransferase RlmH [Mitsuokella sp. AF33-22]
MKITIVCAGKIKEKYLSMGIAEFLKRLKPFAQVEIREIHEEKMPDDPSPAEKEQTLAREGEKLLKLVPQGSYLFVLDVYGREKSSEELAASIAQLGLSGRSSITFLIGGAFGLSEEVRKRADERLSFSPMTFTHQMVRLLLVEQIYRAFKINRGEKYHW